jgi:hypothetical protein
MSGIFLGFHCQIPSDSFVREVPISKHANENERSTSHNSFFVRENHIMLFITYVSHMLFY